MGEGLIRIARIEPSYPVLEQPSQGSEPIAAEVEFL